MLLVSESLPRLLCRLWSNVSTIAVAAHLALYDFSLKTSGDTATSAPLAPSATSQNRLSCLPVVSSEAWDEGIVYAYAQNLAKTVRSHIMCRPVTPFTLPT